MQWKIYIKSMINNCVESRNGRIYDVQNKTNFTFICTIKLKRYVSSLIAAMYTVMYLLYYKIHYDIADTELSLQTHVRTIYEHVLDMPFIEYFSPVILLCFDNK